MPLVDSGVLAFVSWHSPASSIQYVHTMSAANRFTDACLERRIYYADIMSLGGSLIVAAPIIYWECGHEHCKRKGPQDIKAEQRKTVAQTANTELSHIPGSERISSFPTQW